MVRELWPEWIRDPRELLGVLEWSGAFYRRMAAHADSHRHWVLKGHLAAYGLAR